MAITQGPSPEEAGFHIQGTLASVRFSQILSVLGRIPGSARIPAHVPPVRPSIDPDQTQAKPSVLSETVNPPAAVVEAVTQQASGYRALVVDDSAAIQKSLELNLRTLEEIGIIDFADSGEIALEKAESVQYDLIFLDVMMPGIDGYETCTRLRKLAGYKKTPIVMVSGKTSPLDEVKGVIAGCTTYVTKPIDKDEFKKLGGRILAWLANFRSSNGRSR